MAGGLGYLFGVSVMFSLVFDTHTASYDLYNSCGLSPIPVNADDIAKLSVEGSDADPHECSVTFRTIADGEALYYKITEFSVTKGDVEIMITSHFTYYGRKMYKGIFTQKAPPTLYINKRADQYMTVTVTQIRSNSLYTAKFEITNDGFKDDGNTGSLYGWVIALIVISCIVFVVIVIVCTVIVCKRRRATAKPNVRTPGEISTTTNTTAHTGYLRQNTQQVHFIPQAEQPISFQGTNSVPQAQMCSSPYPGPPTVAQPSTYKAYPSSNHRLPVESSAPPPSYDEYLKTVV